MPLPAGGIRFRGSKLRLFSGFRGSKLRLFSADRMSNRGSRLSMPLTATSHTFAILMFIMIIMWHSVA